MPDARHAATLRLLVMLLDCAKLKHWKVAEDFDRLFKREREYKNWMNLGYEDKDNDRPARARVERLRQADPTRPR